MKLNKKTELFQPIREIWDNLNYKDISTFEELNLLLNENKIITKFNSRIDNGLFHSITNYDNMNICLCWGLNKKQSYDYYINNLKDNYSLYGIKSLEIKEELIIKLIYQLYYFRTSFQNKESLEEYINNNLTYLSEISNNIMLNLLIMVSKKQDLTIINNTFQDKVIYMPLNSNEKYIATSLFFCNKSYEFLKLQNLDTYFNPDFNDSKLNFEKYEIFLRTNIDIKHRGNFMLYSSIILYLLGARKANDLDLYIHNVPSEIQDKLKIFKEAEFDFIDYSIKGTEKWPIHWDIWLDEWAKLCGAKYFEEILGNPKYHFYFLGVKIISLDCDIVRRIKRNRPRAIADLIALRKRYNLNINIPSIPEKTLKYESSSDKSEDEINNLVNKGAVLNKENNEIVIEYNTDVNKFIDTVIYALKLNYKMDFTIDDIKRELNMLSTVKKIKVIIKKKIT